MAAHADDLRHYFAERIGRSEVYAGVASGAETVAEPLLPGRYRLHTLAVAGAALLWVRQGEAGKVTAVAAAPSTPIDLAESPRSQLVFMVKPSTTGLAFITDAGSVTVVVSRISE